MKTPNPHKTSKQRLETLLQEEPSAAHRHQVLTAARHELAKRRPQSAWRGLWPALTAVTGSVACVALFTWVAITWMPSQKPLSKYDQLALIETDPELLEHIDWLEDLEVIEHLEELEAWTDS